MSRACSEDKIPDLAAPDVLIVDHRTRLTGGCHYKREEESLVDIVGCRGRRVRNGSPEMSSQLTEEIVNPWSLGYLSIYLRKEFNCCSPRCPSVRDHDRLKAWKRLGSVVFVRHERYACH